MNHIINISNDTKKVIQITKSRSYTFSTSNKKYDYIKNISIYNPKQIQKLVIRKIKDKIKRLKLITDDVTDSSDATSTDFMMVIDENFKLQEVLKTKYKEFLKKEYYEIFLNELVIMNKKIEEKVLSMNGPYDEYGYEYEERKGR